MRKHLIFGLLIGLLLAIGVGWLDYETTSWAVLFQLQNIPALLIYTLLFGIVIFLMIRLLSFVVENVKAQREVLK